MAWLDRQRAAGHAVRELRVCGHQRSSSRRPLLRVQVWPRRRPTALLLAFALEPSILTSGAIHVRRPHIPLSTQ